MFAVNELGKRKHQRLNTGHSKDRGQAEEEERAKEFKKEQAEK